MQNIWLASSLWIGLALAASIISIRVSISVALIEIIVGAIAGNAIGLDLTPWVNFLAGFGAIMLTFLAGTEIDAGVIRRNIGRKRRHRRGELSRSLSGGAVLRPLTSRLDMAGGANRRHLACPRLRSRSCTR